MAPSCRRTHLWTAHATAIRLHCMMTRIPRIITVSDPGPGRIELTRLPRLKLTSVGTRGRMIGWDLTVAPLFEGSSHTNSEPSRFLRADAPFNFPFQTIPWTEL